MFDQYLIRMRREVKSKAGKSALLVGLFLIGCCLWAPIVLQAITAARPNRSVASNSSPAAQNAPDPEMLIKSVVASTGQPEEFWSKLAATLANDPLYQTADVRSLNRNPFQQVEIAEPLPVLFADEPASRATINADENAKGLQLRSTIIGRTRRAAMINGQVYQLGRKIQTDHGQYLLTTIESNRVVLSSGGQTIELTLARPQLKDVLNRNETAVSPVQ